MRFVLAIELEKSEEGSDISREVVRDDFIAEIQRESVWVDGTEYQVSDVTEVKEGYPLNKGDVHFLARVLRGERAATSNDTVRKRIDNILGRLGEFTAPDTEVEVGEIVDDDVVPNPDDPPSLQESFLRGFRDGIPDA